MRLSRITALVVGLALALTLIAASAYAQSHSLTGVVYSAAGQPAPSLVVKVLKNGHERGRSLTGDDGRYFIGSVQAGTYTVVVTRRQGDNPLLQKQVQVNGDTRLDLRLQ